MSEPTTPLMRQYVAIKKEHPNALLFFRLGDFYELFFDDAVTAARELQITLTARHKESDNPVPMCGVPYHSAENYLNKLIRRGYKVAICEQVEDPKVAKKLVRREVTRVLTPGTALDSSVGADENNFLAAVARVGETIGFAVLDLSTGDFRATEFEQQNARRVADELQNLRPREVLYASGMPLFDRAARRGELQSDNTAYRFAETPLDEWIFAPDYAVPLVENHFGVLSLEGFGLAGRTAAASAAGAILHYVRETQKSQPQAERAGVLAHVDRIGFYDRHDCLVLDAVTVRNLELVEPLFANAGTEVTHFRAIDATVTPMGKRLLRSWMLRPSIDLACIRARHEAVAAFVATTVGREELRNTLGGVLDLERLLSKVTLETATPRDVLALADSCTRLPRVRQQLASIHGASSRLTELTESVDPLQDIEQRVTATIAPEPPLTFVDGGVIRDGVDASLDELRDISRNGKQYIANIEQRERERSGINSLKVKFNSVFGYYFEISKANLHLVPQDFERKQTLVNAERFTTPELKEYETKVLAAQEKIVEIERRIFAELRSAIAAEARRIRQTALALAEIDVLAGLANIAALRDYCRPEMLEEASSTLEIVAGRHPVIECQEIMQSSERFVPNDLFLDGTSQTMLLLTGPNMGGKSTYLRQTALIVLLAQMGSFVPARSAKLSLVDRIFTRIGAADNLARGRSTFMVEMTETAAILNTATARSLILLDEIGRGTATYDGLSIAWAVIEYLATQVGAKTLFATHYHEITALAEQLPGLKNFHVGVKEAGGHVVFLRKIEPGPADKSYGIDVAKLAGLPNAVISRAREVLSEHESAERGAVAHLTPGAREETIPPAQLTIFTPLSQKIVDQLRETDLNALTPIQALNLLHELKKQLD